NWELSAARAASVVHLFTQAGMDPRRLAIVGLGEFRPAQSNDTEQGRNLNRRVLLVILSGNGMPEGDYASDRGKPDIEAAPQPQPEPVATTVQATPALPSVPSVPAVSVGAR
ncbi:OmpA family protein, partial [Steroidobacter sp.]|uniref:OmpA family protein n=1 Tax=Steroidobacter sp. TaxID=1978227 RepID=UPI001A623E45